MEPEQKKKVVVGVIIGVLAIVVLWANFGRGGGPSRKEADQGTEATNAAVAAIQEAEAEAPPVKPVPAKDLKAGTVDFQTSTKN